MTENSDPVIAKNCYDAIAITATALKRAREESDRIFAALSAKPEDLTESQLTELAEHWDAIGQTSEVLANQVSQLSDEFLSFVAKRVSSDWAARILRVAHELVAIARRTTGEPADFVRSLKSDFRTSVVLPLERQVLELQIDSALVVNSSNLFTVPRTGEDAPLIPPDKQTKPLTKKQAAKLLGRKGNESRAVEWLNACIDDQIIRWEKRSRQSGVYHIDDFPEHAHDKIRPG